MLGDIMLPGSLRRCHRNIRNFSSTSHAWATTVLARTALLVAGVTDIMRTPSVRAVLKPSGYWRLLMKLNAAIASCALGMMFQPFALRADEWPQFRGPGSLGISNEKSLPSEWGPDKHIRWKVEIPGTGWSSPIVWGDKIYVTTAVTDKQDRPKSFNESYGGLNVGKATDNTYRWQVLCLDRASGKVLWNRTAAEGKPASPIHPSNSFASETPVTDGERVFASFGSKGLYCYNMTGELIWSKTLGVHKMQMGWGTGSSPVLDGNRLFLQCDNEEKSFVVALDKRNGEELWRVERYEKSSWGTPFIWRNTKRTELVTGGGKKVRSYDAATGKLLWELGGMSGTSTITPVSDDERLYTGSSGMPGSNSPLLAVRAGAAGDITLKEDQTSNAGVAWCKRKVSPFVTSPLVYRGYIYVLEARLGMVSCYDAKTGEPGYTKQRLPAKGFTSSPWAYDGKIFCLGQDGQTFVLAAGPEFKLLARNDLNETFGASPAVAGGNLFLRSVTHLYCVDP
jgi:outer membrane protein assembly factor BamB